MNSADPIKAAHCCLRCCCLLLLCTCPRKETRICNTTQETRYSTAYNRALAFRQHPAPGPRFMHTVLVDAAQCCLPACCCCAVSLVTQYMRERSVLSASTGPDARSQQTEPWHQKAFDTQPRFMHPVLTHAAPCCLPCLLLLCTCPCKTTQRMRRQAVLEAFAHGSMSRQQQRSGVDSIYGDTLCGCCYHLLLLCSQP